MNRIGLALMILVAVVIVVVTIGVFLPGGSGYLGPGLGDELRASQ